MNTGLRWKNVSGAALIAIAILCGGSLSPARATSEHSQKKSKKPAAPLVQLPSGPTGPVQQIPLDSQPSVPPQVSYQNNQLTIVAPNSTLADILRAIRKQTGAEIEIPSAPERVVTHLGPGPAREVVAELLNGSRFNYVLLGSQIDDATLTRVVLVAKTGPQDISPTPNQDPSLAPPPVANAGQQPEQMPEAEAESADDNADDNADQPAAEADQQQSQPQDQNGVKTPQQMLQEMQQRQMQLQQQQQPGQPPIPGPGRPPGPPQQQ